MVQTDEQQGEMLCKALKKHFEKEVGQATGPPPQQNQPPKNPVPQRPNNTLGDFITIETKSSSKKANQKAPRAGRGVGRGIGRGDVKKEPGPGGSMDGPSAE